MIKNCIMCGAEFEAYQRTNKFCCATCRNRARGVRTGKYGKNGIMVKTCSVCGKEFTTTIFHKKTCSDECSKKWKNQKGRSRREYFRQRYLKEHPNARTMNEILAESKAKKEARIERQAAREAEWARIRTEKEKKKQKNIEYWLNYEAEHTCKVCGKKFIANYPLTEICSDKCRRKGYKQRHGNTKKRYKGITIDSDISLFKLAERDHDQCQICGLLVDWTDKIETDKTVICGDMYPSIDHKIPISLGGLHSWDNVKLAHRICNSRKSNKYIG